MGKEANRSLFLAAPRMATVVGAIFLSLGAVPSLPATHTNLFSEQPAKAEIQSSSVEDHAQTRAGQADSGQAKPADAPRGDAVLGQVSALLSRVSPAAAAGGAGVILTLATSLILWRQARGRRKAENTGRRRTEQSPSSSRMLEESQRSLEETQTELQRESTARQALEVRLQQVTTQFEKRLKEQTAELAKNCAALEEELGNRKRAENTLVIQRQELSRSKDLLEMHVQARTQEIQKLKSRYEQVLNSAGEGIYGLDLQDNATFVNPAAAKLTDWKIEELIGKSEREILQPPVPDRAGASAESARGPGEFGTDRIFRRRDGSTFPVEYNRTPILEHGRLVGSVVIFRDITERKRAEETLTRKAAELARSNAELEQFAYVASHDLQEPLRKIQAFGDRLKTKVEAANLSEGRDYLDRMQNASARMQSLIQDLLTFSRVISSSQPFVRVDLGVIAKEVLGDLEVLVEKSQAQIEVGALPALDADPTQMRQLLQNLISNSIKFQPPNQAPRIKIGAQVLKCPFSCVADPTPDDEVCELTVQDNGIGFDEQYLEKIFAVFQRLHGRSEYEGTGVGLAVCRRITDRHGGTITARSKPGEGATFIARLPFRRPKKGPAS